MSACIIEWYCKSLTPADRMTQAEFADRAFKGLLGTKMWTGKGKHSLSLVPPCLLQNKICWIWVWRRLTRELGGCPWGVCVCFPKIAPDTHYEQLTTVVSCLLSPAFCPPCLCQENIWGSATESQDLTHIAHCLCLTLEGSVLLCFLPLSSSLFDEAS